MNNSNIEQVLNQMRALTQTHGIQETRQAPGVDFAAVLKQSVDKVNELQQQAGELRAAFETGDPNADIADVMVAVQKASLSFEAATEVRNKLLSAYQEVMNMQV